MTSEDVLQGGCYCGAVRYEVNPPLRFVAHDHCSICRRIAGAAFTTWGGVTEAQCRVVAGAEGLVCFRSTPTAERQFCRTCGSHLFFRAERWPGEVHFTFATLDDPGKWRPRAHVFYSDRASWCEMHDELPCLGGADGTSPIE